MATTTPQRPRSIRLGERRSISVIDHRPARGARIARIDRCRAIEQTETDRIEPEPPDRAPTWAGPLLDVRDLRWCVAGRSAVGPLSFEVRSDDCVGIVEACADRRTSVVRLLTGTIEPTGGSIERHDAGGDVAFVPRHGIMSPTTSLEHNLAIWARLFGLAKCDRATRIREALVTAGLWVRRHQPVRTGETEVEWRFGLAVALLRRPGVLVLESRSRLGSVSASGASDDLADDRADELPDSFAVLNTALAKLRVQGLGIVVVSEDSCKAEKVCDRLVHVS